MKNILFAALVLLATVSCGPCRAETPYMIELYNHYKNDPRIQLVSISLDAKRPSSPDIIDWIEGLLK